MNSLALYTVRVTFNREHRQWISHDESESLGFVEATKEFKIAAISHYEDIGHAAIKAYIDNQFRHEKKFADGSSYKLEILKDKINIDAVVELKIR